MRGAVLAVIVAACGRDNFDAHEGSWVITAALGPCSDSCTTGTQPRLVECRDEAGEVIADSECVGARPPTAQACAETGCSWSVGDWQGCSVRCGGGTEDRVVECRTSSGIVAPDEQCLDARPPATQACNTQACCDDLDYPVHELTPDTTMVCGAPIRYMIEPDAASTMQRCQELGYDQYGGSVVLYTAAEWCDYCNARTKYWSGTAWVSNGCMVGVHTLRCCDLP